MKAASRVSNSKPLANAGWSPAAVAMLRDVLVAALLALLVATPLVIGDTVATGGFSIDIYPPIVLFMAWLLLPIGWGVMGLLSRRFVWRWERVDSVVVAMFVFIVLSSMAMAWEGNPRAVINTTWRWVVLGIAYLLMRQMLDRPIYRRAAVATMLATSAMLATHGYYQYFYDLPQTRATYEKDAEAILMEQGIDPTPGSRERELFENRLNSPQPLATFALTNSLAGFLVPWLVMGAGLLAVNWREASLRPRVPIGLGAVLVLGGGCLLLTESRSGYLALLLGLVAVGLGAFGVRLKPKALLGLIGLTAVLLAVACGFALAGGLQSELVSGTPASLRYRLEYWQSTAAMIADYPIWGCGVGNFQDFYTAYMLPQASETIADPHNFLMEVWASAGTPAALCLLAAIALVALRFTKRGEESEVVAEAPPAATQGRKRREETAELEELPPPDYRILAVGLLFGPAAGWLLGLVGGFEPDRISLLLSWPVLAVVAWLLSGWVINGRMPAWLPAIAGAALLVNLLAAGGISFPAVAMNLWLLAALAIGGTGKSRERAGGLASAGVVFVASLALAGAYLITGYWPPLAAYSQIASGDDILLQQETLLPEGSVETAALIQQTQIQYALNFYLSAASSDPYSPVPYQRQGSLSHDLALGASLSWFEGKDEEPEAPPVEPESDPEPPVMMGPLRPQPAREIEEPKEEVEQVADTEPADEEPQVARPSDYEIAGIWVSTIEIQRQVIARDRRSAVEQRRLGTRCLEAYRVLGGELVLEDALAAFMRAVELYPVDSSGQAALAWAYHLAGEEKKAARHAEEALRLDDLNPHTDRALERQDLYHQPADLPEETPLRLAPLEGNPREWMESLATPSAPAP